MALESLERRLLLASDVTIGVIDDSASYVRTPGVGTVVYSPTTDAAEIGERSILSDLDAGLIVTVDTVNASGLGEGNITLLAANLSLANLVDATLDLRADNDVVFVGSTVEALTGSLSVIVNADRDGSGSGRVEVDGGSLINSNGAAITIGGGADPATGFAVGNANVPVGVFVAGMISGGAGDVSIRGQGINGGARDDTDGVQLLGATVATSTGSIAIDGFGGDTSGNRAAGVSIRSATVATTSGDLSVTGMGGGTGTESHGVFLEDFITAAAVIRSQSGSVTVSGSGSPTAAGNSDGIRIENGVNVISSFIGSVTLSGIKGTGGVGLRSGFGGTDIIGAATTTVVTINADTLDLDGFGGATSLRGSGRLFIQPLQPGTSIGLGGAGGSSATLELNATEIGFLADGFSSIIIGDAVGGTGVVSIDGATFTDPVTIVGSSISVDNGLAGDGGVTLTTIDAAGAGQDVNINSGTVSDLTGNVTITAGDDVTVFSVAAITTAGASAMLVISVDQAPDPDAGVGSTVTIGGTLSNAGTTFTGGADADTFSITPQAGSSLDVIGNDPTTSPGDALSIDARGADVTIDAGTGAITVAGAQPFTTTGIENLSLANVATLTINGDVGVDNVMIANNAGLVGSDLLTINGQAPIAISSVNRLVFNGMEGDDVLTYDAAGGSVTTPITFNGGMQSGTGGGDALNIVGSFASQTLNYTVPGVDGNSGSAELDGTLVTYTGLEPIIAGDSVDTVLNFSTGLSNSAILQDNANADFIEIIDSGATLQDTLIPNPTNSLTINLSDQGDSLSVASLDANYAASMIINGGAGIDDVQFNGVTIVGTPGRGLDVVNIETLGITGSSFRDNVSDVGAGLRVIGGTTTINNSTFTGNTATGNAATQGGGAIFNDGVMTVQGNSNIDGNRASGAAGSGGGILNGPGGMLTVIDSTISNNLASIDGGGIFAEGGTGAVTLMGVTIAANVSGDSGAGVFIDGPTTSIVNSTFTRNEAQGTGGLDGDGGGLFVRGQAASGNFTISDTSFFMNTAFGGGGGAFFVDVDGSVSGGSFTANQVAGNGTTFESGSGGLAIIGETRVTTVDIAGVAVDGNTAPAAAGIGIIDSLVTIDNSTISNNVASETRSGGGGIGAVSTVALPGNVLTLIDSSVTGNATAGEGGGLGIINGDVSITDTTIAGNQATGGRGGGIGFLNNGLAGSATIRNTTISANTASANGGGIAVLNMGLDLENVTISTNDAGSVGGGIAYDNNVNTLTNSISFSTITSNTSLSGGSNISATGSPIDVIGTIFNDGVSAAPAGVLNSLGGNLDSGITSGFNRTSDLVNTDPLLGPLQDNGGPVQTHLLPIGSPAIDTGPTAGPTAFPTTDARGVARPQDGDGDGTFLFDIGAVESGSVFALVVDDVTVDENVGSATVIVRIATSIPGGFTVDFTTGDGTAIQPGDYTTATGTLTFAGTANESQSFTITIVDDAVVEASETLLVSLTGPSNPNIDASDTAVLTIADDDVAMAISGDVFCDANNNGQNDTGEEAPGTLVFLDTNGNGRLDQGERSTTTNATGIYQFDNLTVANVIVSAMVPANCNTIPDSPGVTRSTIPVGDVARAITSADIDGDGDQDLLVSADLSNSLTVVENTPSGFIRGIDIALGDRPQSIFAYHPNLTQPPIIAVAGIGTPASGGAVYTIDGQGTPIRHPGTAGPIDALIDDFNSDGRPDVLSASFRESILELRMSGSSDVSIFESLSDQILSIASGNLVDPTSTREVVVSGFGFGESTKLEVFGIDSSGEATKFDSIDTAPTIVEAAIENIIDASNQDSVDEIVALYSSGKIVVYPMSGLSIGAGIETSVMPDASAFDFGDFNKDGITDVAVANLSGQFIELLTGTGDGRFALVTTVRNVSAPSDLVVDDFNGDGFDDIAVANFYTDANIDDPTLPPSFSLPSTTTILQLEIASRDVVVTSDTVTSQDFRFPTADPDVLLDTNSDNRITALDALRVINVLNLDRPVEGEQISTNRAATDVNGDGRTSAVDALMIINYLMQQSLAEDIQINIDDLIPNDNDDDDRDQLVAAIDLALTQNLMF